MNSFLADMYGTRETIGADSSQDQDVEKLAEAQLLDQALQAEGVDVDNLDAGTLLKVAYNLFGEDSALVKAATEEAGDEGLEEEPPAKEKKETKEETEEETDEEKAASADMLGRVMAHAFVQEQSMITKEALSLGGAKEGVSAALKAIKAAPGKARDVAETAAYKLKSPGRTFKHVRQEEGAGVPKALLETMRAHKGMTGIGAGTAAAGGGVALKKKLEKKNSALDAIAEERALEILKEAGVETEAVPTEEEKLAAAIEQRAWEMLAENGYTE